MGWPTRHSERGSVDFALFEVCGFSLRIHRRAAEFPRTGNSALQGRKFLFFWQAFSRRHRELGKPSFPRKRESNAESIAGPWIPAFAGMTAPSPTVALGCGRKAALRYPLFMLFGRKPQGQTAFASASRSDSRIEARKDRLAPEPFLHLSFLFGFPRIQDRLPFTACRGDRQSHQRHERQDH